LAAVVSDHHDWPEDNDPLKIERIQLQLTDMIASHLGYGPAQQYDLLNSKPAIALGLDQQQASIELLTALPDRVEDAMTWL